MNKIKFILLDINKFDDVEKNQLGFSKVRRLCSIPHEVNYMGKNHLQIKCDGETFMLQTNKIKKILKNYHILKFLETKD